jgi:hypothetical protein
VWREENRQEDRDEENRNEEDQEVNPVFSSGGRKPPFDSETPTQGTAEIRSQKSNTTALLHSAF